MVEAIVFAVVLGGLVALGLCWREVLAREREARNREQLAVVVLYEEMQATIDSLESALKADRSKWLLSMSQSPALTKAWREHGEALLGLGAERWGVISDAVSGVAPSHRPVSVSWETADLQRLLTQRRELLMRGAEILRAARDP